MNTCNRSCGCWLQGVRGKWSTHSPTGRTLQHPSIHLSMVLTPPTLSCLHPATSRRVQQRLNQQGAEKTKTKEKREVQGGFGCSAAVITGGRERVLNHQTQFAWMQNGSQQTGRTESRMSSCQTCDLLSVQQAEETVVEVVVQRQQRTGGRGRGQREQESEASLGGVKEIGES